MAHVEIYTSLLCGYCYRAKGLLKKKGVAFDEFGVDIHPSKRQEMIQRANGRTSVPQIFIDGVHVGGSDDLALLEREGRLDAMLGLG